MDSGKVQRRKSVKFNLPDPDKKIVSMAEWRGSIYVATERGIYRISENNTLVRLKIVDIERNETPVIDGRDAML